MKHTINLYRADLLPKRPLLDLQRVLSIMLLVWVVAVGFRVVLEVQALSLTNQVNAAQQEQRQKQQLLTQLSAQVAQLRVDPELERRVRVLRARTQNQRSILVEFREIGRVQSFDYAAILTELAQVHQDGIWLTKVEENNGVLNLHGFTVDPAILPYWMQKFRDKEHLSRRHFGRIQMNRVEDIGLSFVVSGLEVEGDARPASSAVDEAIDEIEADDSADEANESASTQPIEPSYLTAFARTEAKL